MSYGQNAPAGLQPFMSVTGGSWTEKANTYLISNGTANGITTGYASSIFNGDPVVFNTANTAPAAPATGYLATAGTIALYNPTYADAAPSTFAHAPILGVFQSCEYESPVTSVNNIIQSSYWPGGAQIVPGTNITAKVIDDPMVIWNIQMSTHINAANTNFSGLVPALPVHNPAGNNAASVLSGSFGSNFALNIGGGTNFNTILNQFSFNNMNYANNPANGNVLTGQSAYFMDVTTPTGGVLTHDYDKSLATLPLKAIGYVRNASNVPQLNPNDPVSGPYTYANTPFLNVMVYINNHVYRAGTPGVIFGANQN